MTEVAISGPVTGGVRGWPFGATTRDLAAEGYVEEEYIVAGEATRYSPLGAFEIDGRWPADRAGTTPFRTRVVVRRPIDSERFNGTVVVEWNNVSAGVDIFEAGDTSVIFDEGFAYVGASVQRVGVHGHDDEPGGLQAWDPQRYGSLDLVDDAVSYGVFTEIGRAFGPHRESAVDPLAGLAVRRLIGIGGSQSAGRLATYVNAVQPIERVFDGFVLFTWFGSGMSLDDPRTLNLASGGLDQIVVHPTSIRDDLDVPVLVVNTECEALSCYPVRQPDTERFRFWEVAGAPHAPKLHMERIFLKLMRDQVGLPTPAEASALPTQMVLSPVPFAPVLDAGLASMPAWIDHGIAPPSQPLIDIDGQGESVRIVRDDDGNATGGVRVPEMEVTVTRNVGAREESGPAGLMGITTPLPAEVVRARYTDSNGYVAAFRAAAERAVAAGVLRRRDADEAIERARHVAI